MPVSDVLKNMRDSGYGDKPGAKPADDSSESSPAMSRVIKLTDDEMKSLEGSAGAPGEEMTLTVTGKLEEDGSFSVMNVGAEGGGPDDAAKQVADGVLGVPPMMQNQTMPSPS